ALLALPGDADRRRHVLGPDHHRRAGEHAHRRAARRLPRVLRPPQPRRDHGPDEVLKASASRAPPPGALPSSMTAVGKILPKSTLSLPLSLSGGASATLADYAGQWL